MATEAPVKKVKMMDKRLDWKKIGDRTLVQTFGKVGTVKSMTQTLWKLIKKEGLLLD